MPREPFRPRSGLSPLDSPSSTRWFDNDVFGHVNNTIYYGWLDTAVCGWLMEAGLLEVDGEDLIGLVVDTGCAYASPVSFPEKVEIGLRVAKMGNSSVTYHLGVFVEGAESALGTGTFHPCLCRPRQPATSTPG